MCPAERVTIPRRHLPPAVLCALALMLLPVGVAVAGTPKHGLAALTRAEAVWKRRRPGKPVDLSSLLQRIAAAMPSYQGTDRRAAASLLARPTDGAADPQQDGYTAPEARNSPYCSAHFCVHWVASGADAPNLSSADGSGVPSYVEQVDAVAENVYSVEVGALGWRPPKSDGAIGGGLGKTDIYLKNLGGTGVYGYTAPDPNQLQGHQLYAYLVLDNTFDRTKFPQYSTPLTPLEVTLAHEFNHVLQFNYDALEDTWMFESTAVWAEGKVYPLAYDYLQYLPGWEALTTVPLTKFNGTDPNDRRNVKVYGSAVWNKWLDARYGANVVRDAWADSVHTTPVSFAPGAYDASIRQHGGAGFPDSFDRFAAATAEWQAGNSGFPDGALYADIPRAGTLSVGGPTDRLRLDHTTFRLLGVPGTGLPRVKLVATLPNGTTGAVALVGRHGGGSGATQFSEVAELPRGGTGAVTLTDTATYNRLTAVLVNSDVTEHGYLQSLPDWQFTKDNQLFVAHVTTDFQAPRLRGRSPGPGASASGHATIVVTFSKSMLGIGSRSVELVASNGRRVAVRVRLARGARRLLITPRRALRGGHYRIKLLGTIADADLNHLRATAWSFTVR